MIYITILKIFNHQSAVYFRYIVYFYALFLKYVLLEVNDITSPPPSPSFSPFHDPSLNLIAFLFVIVT